MINFAKLKFELLTKDDLFKVRKDLLFVVTANSEIIVMANENAQFAQIVKNAQLTFDGQIPFILAKLLNPRFVFEKISGSDLIYDLAQYGESNQKKIFLLGGKTESNYLAVKKIKEKYPLLKVEGYSPPFSSYPFEENITSQIVTRLTEFKPHIVLVGFGAFKQELWISDHYDFLNSLGVEMAIGTGGTFEFVAGIIKRAPKLIQKIGMEGVYRFLVEPKWFRFKRLLVSFKLFKYIF